MSEEEEQEEMPELSSLGEANAFLVRRIPSTHYDSPKMVGSRIREMRKEAGYSMRQLSHPGCSAAYLSRLEAGDRIPSGHLLLKLAYALDTSPIYLALGKGNKHGCPGWVVYWLSLGDPVEYRFLNDSLKVSRHYRQTVHATIAVASPA